MSAAITLNTAAFATAHLAGWDRADLSHDDGLQHDHHWARDREAGQCTNRGAASPSTVPTPSSAVHDDIHYGLA